MSGKIKNLTLAGILIITVLQVLQPTFAVGAPAYEGDQVTATQKVEGVIPFGIQMVDRAIAVLEKGYGEMTSVEKEQFLRYFDPASTGEIDGAFVLIVLENFRKIRHKLDGQIPMVFETDNEMCYGMRMYYTDFIKVHICPYIFEETDERRMARDLVHELVHMTLLVRDRAYYSTTSSAYTTLTPQGHWTAQIPLLGRIAREIATADTLYNPDTYAKYAAELFVQE